MTVEELIEKLKLCRPTSTVMLPNEFREDGLWPLQYITETLNYEYPGAPVDGRVVLE